MRSQIGFFERSDDAYVELLLRDNRALVGVLSEGVADLESPRLLSELAKELIVNLGVNVDTRAGTAGLAVIVAIPDIS